MISLIFSLSFPCRHVCVCVCCTFTKNTQHTHTNTQVMSAYSCKSVNQKSDFYHFVYKHDRHKRPYTFTTSVHVIISCRCMSHFLFFLSILMYINIVVISSSFLLECNSSVVVKMVIKFTNFLTFLFFFSFHVFMYVKCLPLRYIDAMG